MKLFSIIYIFCKYLDLDNKEAQKETTEEISLGET